MSPTGGQTSRSIRKRLYGASLSALLLGLTACASSDSGEEPAPPASSPAEAVVCSNDPDGFTVAEDGWNLKQVGDGEWWLNYTALFTADDTVDWVDADVRVEWFDGDGDPLGWSGGEDPAASGEVLPMAVSGPVGAVSDWVVLADEPDRVEYTVVNACRRTDDHRGTLTVTDPAVDVTDGEAELSFTIASGHDTTEKVDLIVVFRNEAGAIIGGSLSSDGDIAVGEVDPGDSEHTVTFEWDDVYPDPGDVDTVEVYATSLG